MPKRSILISLFQGVHIALAMLACAVVVGFLQHIIHVYIKVHHGNNLVENTIKYEKNQGQAGRALIIGDSLAYGVGTSSPEASFAGAIARRLPDHQIINKSVIGDTTSDLVDHIEDTVDRQYSSIFILIGGNDILRPKVDLPTTQQNIYTIIEHTTKHADNVYLITTPDFAHVSFVPWLARSYYSNRSIQVHRGAITATKNYTNAHYIDTYAINETVDYAKLQASDGFHLNDKGIEVLVDLLFSSHPHQTY